MKWIKQLILVALSAFFLVTVTPILAQANSHTDFIQRVSKPAEKISKKYHLYGSVMIAQAALESNWGTSELTNQANNYFGIKGRFNGQSVTLATTEENGHGLLVGALAQFKAYPSMAASFDDYAQVLRHGTDWNPFLYQGVWREHATAYTDATKTLAHTYATDSAYGEKLNRIIQIYHLQRFDLTTSNKDDADHTVQVTPGVAYAEERGIARVKPGKISVYDSVPGPATQATATQTARLGGRSVRIISRAIVNDTQSIWYQINWNKKKVWVPLTSLLNLRTG